MTRTSTFAAAPEAIASALRSEIVGGALPPGTELVQNDLAARFAASRIPVREALRLLEAEGLVAVQANRGAQVTSLSAADVAEIFHLRLLLEPDCLGSAIPNMSATDLDEIDRLRRRAEIDAGTPEWGKSDWRFHEGLYAPARRPLQIEAIRKLRLMSRLYSAAHATLPSRKTQWLKDHSAIVEHCRAKRVKAAVTILSDHLKVAAAQIQSAFVARR